uniref:Uncharacterized protein n=1 Tax=Arundo donax TaxID=35708 RepID=A0A0A9ARH8_ARUDO
MMPQQVRVHIISDN